jgi:hypothetical protein
MVDKSEGYARPRRAMIIRNILAALLAIPAGVIAAVGVLPAGHSIFVGVVVAALVWLGVLFVSAKGH